MDDDMQNETDMLITFIEGRYNTKIRKLHTLADGWKKVYRVERADGPDWVVRVFPPPGYAGQPVSMTGMVEILSFLERQAYPAERTVKSIDHTSVTQHGDWQVLITTLLSGVRQHW